ncbi:MAG: DUF1934 family protein [Breznakia sp.]
MIKKALIRHQHLYTKEASILYEGDLVYNIYDDYEEFLYQDEENARVQVLLYEDSICIIRQGEVQSTLTFEAKKTTKNCIKSVYGDMSINIYTHFYHRNKNIIELVYDVSDAAEKEGFHIIFELKEDAYEYH